MKENGVTVKLPSINKSTLEFSPDVEHNAIVYGLKPVKNINNEIVDHIIANRPYHSLDDVLTKLYDTKLITNKHLISIVKSGMLDEFGERKKIMMDVVKYITDLKTNLTLANIKLLLEADILSERPEYELVLLRENIKNKVLRKVQTGKSKTKHKIFKVEDTELYDRLIGNEAIVNVVGSHYEVDEKEFKKSSIRKLKI